MILENILDVSGESCPIPLMKTKKEMKNYKSGELLKLISTDPQTEKDLNKFCNRGKYKLKESIKKPNEYIFIIEKI